MANRAQRILQMNDSKYGYGLLITVWIAATWFHVFISPVFAVEEEPPLVSEIRTALETKDADAFVHLVVNDSNLNAKSREFIDNFLRFPFDSIYVHFVKQDEDKLTLHVFLASDDEAKFESWVVFTSNQLMRKIEVINSLTGLYSWKMEQEYYPVQDVNFHHKDVSFRLQEGKVFLIRVGPEISGFLFQGSGMMQFDPPNDVERQQVALLTNRDNLVATFDSMYIRTTNKNVDQFLGDLPPSSKTNDPDLFAKAESTFRSYDKNVYSVRIPFTDKLWFAALRNNEVHCEMNSNMGNLLYQYTPGEEDDVLILRKDKDQIISLYSSSGIRVISGEGADFQISSYQLDIDFNPLSLYLSAITRIRMTCRGDASRVLFKLNSDLEVSQIRSNQGDLVYFQERQASNLHVVFNEVVRTGDQLLLEFHYQGKLQPELRKPEAMASMLQMEGEFYMPPTFLYSSFSQWYPQLTNRMYAPLRASITVPSGYLAVTNGKLISRTEAENKRKTFTYECRMPVKYFSLFVGRLDGHLSYSSLVPIDVYFIGIDKGAAGRYAKSADQIIRFYSDYFGKYPYPNLSIILRPVQEPGGHAPATVAILNRVFKFFQKKVGRDPLHYPGFPDFLLAHEIAHQWWGQSVGWRSYRDQWLSEGFAQFAAWEYMRATYGEEIGKELADIFFRWVEEKTSAGPLILGARLGHLTEDPQAYSALLYNKGAFTLSMLKNWMGPENFKKCLADFYDIYRFQQVSIRQFQEVAQEHSNEDLTLFFRQWLYGWTIPSVQWSVQDSANQAVLKLHFQQPEDRFYRLKIPVQARSRNGDIVRVLASLNEPSTDVTFDLPFVPSSVEIDPLQETLVDTQRLKTR